MQRPQGGNALGMVKEQEAADAAVSEWAGETVVVNECLGGTGHTESRGPRPSL